MAVTVVSRPDNFASAYNPVEYKFTSSFAGTTGTISQFKEDSSGNVEIFYSGVSQPKLTIREGGIAIITNSVGGLYDGEHVITDRDTTGRFSIDTAYVGDDVGGNLSVSRANIAIICDLYADGSFVVRKTRRPDLTDSFVFDFSREIQVILGNGIKPFALDSPDIAVSSESSSSIYVKYVESYDVTSNGIVENELALDTSQTPNDLFNDSANAKVAVNAVTPHIEFLLGSVRSHVVSFDNNLTGFVVDSAGSNRFLTNSPKSIRIGEDDSYQLSFIVENDTPTKLYKRRVIAYDSTGSILATTKTTVFVTADQVWSMSVGTRHLSASILPVNTTYYEVSIVDENDSDAELTEVITFNIDFKCHGTKTRFCWINPRGGYDTYTFSSPRKLNSSVKKSTYDRSRKQLTVVSDRQESITNVIAQDSISTGTDKIDTETAEWLQELLESPQVFIELDSSGGIFHANQIPVTLINKTRSISDSYNGMFNIKLRYKFAFDKPALRVY